MRTQVRLLQSKKAHAPIVVTRSGIVTSRRWTQPEKAASPIAVTPSGIVTRSSEVQFMVTPAGISEMPSGKAMEVMPQPEKADRPRVFSFAGSAASVSDVQPENALSPI